MQDPVRAEHNILIITKRQSVPVTALWTCSDLFFYGRSGLGSVLPLGLGKAVDKHASLEFVHGMKPSSAVVLMVQWMLLDIDVRLLRPAQLATSRRLSACRSKPASRRVQIIPGTKTLEFEQALLGPAGRLLARTADLANSS